MRAEKIIRSSIILASILVSPHFLMAQAGSSDVSLIAVLIILGALLLVGAIVTVSENLLQIEAKKQNIDTKEKNVSLFPRVSELLGKKGKKYTKGEGVFHLSRGHNILLNGDAEKKTLIKPVTRFAVRPTNFRGIAPIPKLVVKEGDEVMAGDELFFDKSNPDIKYCAPVSGEVVEIRRGAKRSIKEVIILADKKQQSRVYQLPDLAKASREELVQFLIGSGMWPLINQRPYDIVPDPNVVPRDVFISTFDTAPLAPDMNYVIDGNEKAFQKGIDVLARLTSGQVHLGLDANGDNAPSKAFTEAKNTDRHWFSGKHPAGNVGIQIHHINPIRPGHTVWTMNVQNVVALGRLFIEGKYDLSRLIAVGGSKAKTPAYIKTFMGANVGDILGAVSEDVRIIAGDVLTGRKVKVDDFIDATTDQITLIKEGNYLELFGWLLPLELRPTISKTFPNFLIPNLKFDGDTNTHGEKRAFVVTGQYEEVLPMKMFPQHLMKAILANDFEQMEGLGIHELSEEDIALCEFVCTSKQPLQSILRDGLELMREQG